MKKIIMGLLVILVFGSVFSSCDGFFSASWGAKSQREYDADKIDVNTENLDLWIKRAVGNPALAAIINEKIAQIVRTGPYNRDKAILVDGAVKLAVESTGLGQSILSNATGSLMDMLNGEGEGDMDLISSILGDIQRDFNNNGGQQIAENLGRLLIESGSINNTGIGQAPRFDAAYAGIAQPSDVSEAIIVLVLGSLNTPVNEIDLDDLDGIMDGLNFVQGNNGKTIVTVGPGATDADIALAAYANLLNDPAFESKADGNPILSVLKSMLSGNF